MKEKKTVLFLFKDSLQDEEALTKHNRKKENNQQSKLKDFYEECVEMSLALEQSLSKHNWFKANSE